MNFVKKILQLINREIPTDTLVKRGMQLGSNFNRQQGVYIDPTHCFLIEIGDDVTMSIRVTLMAHDASTKKLTGYTKIGKIKIGNHVFIGANATILPGVTVGDHAIIGAGSVVTHDVPPGVVAVGCPAKVICSVEEYARRHQEQMLRAKVFDASYRMSGGLNEEKKREIIAAVEQGIAYID